MKGTEGKKGQRNNGRNPNKSFIADKSQKIAYFLIKGIYLRVTSSVDIFT